MNPSLPVLLLTRMAARHPGLTKPLLEVFLEACRVCLDRHHKSPVDFTISDNGTLMPVRVKWKQADDRCRSAHANTLVATERGACAVALASVELIRGHVAVHTAHIETGADFYVAEAGTPLDDFEKWVRLEVSGTDKGSVGYVKMKLRQKIAQARRGKSNLPAMATVVGFRAKLIAMQDA